MRQHVLMNEQLSEILRLLRKLIRIGTVSAVNLDNGLCRVHTGNLTTGWLHWLTAPAGNTRSWNAPWLGEQVNPSLYTLQAAPQTSNQ